MWGRVTLLCPHPRPRQGMSFGNTEVPGCSGGGGFTALFNRSWDWVEPSLCSWPAAAVGPSLQTPRTHPRSPGRAPVQLPGWWPKTAPWGVALGLRTPHLGPAGRRPCSGSALHGVRLQGTAALLNQRELGRGFSGRRQPQGQQGRAGDFRLVHSNQLHLRDRQAARAERQSFYPGRCDIGGGTGTWQVRGGKALPQSEQAPAAPAALRSPSSPVCPPPPALTGWSGVQGTLALESRQTQEGSTFCGLSCRLPATV